MAEVGGNFLPPVKSAHKPDSPPADVRTRAVFARSNKSFGGRAASTSVGLGAEAGNANPVGWEAPPTPSKRELNKVQFRKHNELPFDIQADVLLGEISKRIKLPRRDGYLTFKSTLRSSASCQLLTYYFWHLYCKRYLSHEKKQTKMFLDLLAEKFVNLFWSLPNSAAKDFFLEYYPYAIAASVCLAFHEHFPGSRLEFTEAFRNTIFQETRHVFSGVDSTAELMQQKRELMGLVSDSDKAGPGAGRPGDPAEPEPVPAAQEEVWTQEELQAELKKIPGYIERKKQRMKRETFDAMDTSPLVRHYVSAIADTHGSKPSFLRRTLIDPKCALGGEETFVRTPSRVDQQEDTLHAWTKFKSQVRGQTKQNRSNMRKEVSELEDTKLSLMSSGSRVVGQYVEDKLAMPQRKKHLL